MQSTNTENKNTQIEINKEEQNDMDFLKAQNNITIIDIPEQVKEADKAEEARIAERERINKHIIFYQFSKKRVYTTAIMAYLMSLAFKLVYTIIDNIIFDDKIENNSNQESIEGNLKKSGFVLALEIIDICIYAPLVEEFIFRSFIFKLINYGGKKVQKKVKVIGIIIRILAFLISSFIFAFAHFGYSFEVLANEIRTFPVYFIMGLLLAYAYNRDGYILASVLMHALNNAVAVLLIFIL